LLLVNNSNYFIPSWVFVNSENSVCIFSYKYLTKMVINYICIHLDYIIYIKGIILRTVKENIKCQKAK